MIFCHQELFHRGLPDTFLLAKHRLSPRVWLTLEILRDNRKLQKCCQVSRASCWRSKVWTLSLSYFNLSHNDVLFKCRNGFEEKAWVSLTCCCLRQVCWNQFGISWWCIRYTSGYPLFNQTVDNLFLFQEIFTVWRRKWKLQGSNLNCLKLFLHCHKHSKQPMQLPSYIQVRIFNHEPPPIQLDESKRAK